MAIALFISRLYKSCVFLIAKYDTLFRKPVLELAHTRQDGIKTDSLTLKSYTDRQGMFFQHGFFIIPPLKLDEGQY
jgi:hypothetical protein